MEFQLNVVQISIWKERNASVGIFLKNRRIYSLYEHFCLNRCLSVFLFLFVCIFIACPRGYFGLNCSYMCPYPTYGRRCLDGKCSCPKEYCNAKNGCGTRKNSLQIYKYYFFYHEKVDRWRKKGKKNKNNVHSLNDFIIQFKIRNNRKNVMLMKEIFCMNMQ